MVLRATRQYTDAEIDGVLLPEVREWFHGAFGTFTHPQRYAVKEIHDGKHVLISSPTGSGKTLSAFLACVNELARLADEGALDDRVHCVYVSPLKALNNDIERNLREPLEGIREEFRRRGKEPPEIRVAVRTGDTPSSVRQSQTRRPPHILITTPETLAILLCAPRFRDHLAGARWVIVDEVHALAENKRGAHLTLSLERLEALVLAAGGAPPVRIGLSATISPLEEVAAFLFGGHDDGLIVDVQYLKLTDLQVVSPVADLIGASSEELSEALYALLDRLIESHRTTLVFTNTRSGTERVVLHLKQRFGRKYAELVADSAPAAGAPEGGPEEPAANDDAGTTVGTRSFVAAHHGSLSRETRLEVEEALKRGDLKCVVCSTSLELGIDIGYVDLVVLLGSPKGVARALQRVGRSGHKLHAVSKGRIVVTDRDDLVEAVVLAKCASERKLDRIAIPSLCLDVLCQHLVGMAIDRVWSVEEAFALVRRAGPYRGLPREDLVACLEYLAGRYEALEARSVYGKIWFDPVSGEFGRRGRMARPIYSMNVGTIPETTLTKVFSGERYVGQVEEEFVENLVPGDVFVLGGHTWQFQHARGMKVHVAPAGGKRPTVPRWSSETLPLSGDLAQEVRRFRSRLAERLETGDPESAKTFLRKEYNVDELTASSIIGYFTEQARFAKLPRDDEVLVEEFVDDDLRRNYVFHTLVGRRANEALSRAFARSLGSQRGINVRVQAADNGFVLVVPRSCILPATELKSLFFSDVRAELDRALENSEILKRRFRHVATRAFLILRNYAGRSQTVGRQQVNSFILFHVLRRISPDFPVLREVYREIRTEAFDLPAAEELCFEVVSRRLRVTYLRNRKAPSPFAFNLVALSGSDAVVMDDRKRMIRDFHERVLELLSEERAA